MTYSLACRLYHYFLCSKFDALVSETEECGDAGFSLGALMHAAVCHEREGVLCVHNWVLSLKIFAFSWTVSNRSSTDLCFHVSFTGLDSETGSAMPNAGG